MSTNSNYPKKYSWLVLVVVPLVVAIIGILPAIFPRPPETPAPAPQPQIVSAPSPQIWTPKGTVINRKTELPIRRAKVSLEFQGVVNTTDTDSEGVYQFTFHAPGEQLVGRVNIEATGYESYDRNIGLASHNMSIDTIGLDPVMSKSPTLEPTSKPVAQVVQIPTPKPEIRSTPLPKPKPLSNDNAVLIVETGKGIDRAFSSTIASLLQQRGVRIKMPSLFTSSFVANGSFDQIFDGSSDDAERLQLPQHFKSAVFGKKTVSLVTHPDQEGLITANVTLELHVVSAQSGTIQTSLSYAKRELGFSNDIAIQKAEEQILQELKTTLSSIINQL